MIHTLAYVTRLDPLAHFTRAILPNARNKTLRNAANFVKNFLTIHHFKTQN